MHFEIISSTCFRFAVAVSRVHKANLDLSVHTEFTSVDNKENWNINEKETNSIGTLKENAEHEPKRFFRLSEKYKQLKLATTRSERTWTWQEIILYGKSNDTFAKIGAIFVTIFYANRDCQIWHIRHLPTVGIHRATRKYVY